MRLWVCCGHGAGDPGACGNGYSEAERVRALGAEIKRRGGEAVVLMDTSRNWYADHGFDSVSIPDGDAVVELHMDATSAGARGGHVVYKAGLSPDAYDRALADGIASVFPGRAERLSARSDLRNCNVCASRGINYRLVENGFVTSASDVATFNARLGEIADLYLRAFGIATPAPVGEAGTEKEEEEEMTECVINVPKSGSMPCNVMVYMCGDRIHDIANPEALKQLSAVYSKVHGRPIPCLEMSSDAFARLCQALRGGVPDPSIMPGVDKYQPRSGDRSDGCRGEA